MKKVIAVFATTVILFSSKSIFAQSEEAGMKAMQAENFNSAKNIFRAILQSNADAKSYFNFGEALYANDQFDSAKLIYNAGLAIDARSKQNMIGVGKCLLNEGKKDEAKKIFDKVLDMAKTNDILTAVLIAQAYIGSEKYSMPDVAIELLNKKKEVNDKSAALYEALGDVYDFKIDGGNAVTSYEAALQNDPNRVTALTKIAEIFVRAKNYDEAIKDFNKALELDPNFPPAHRELSDLYFRAGKFDKAKTEFDAYLKNADPTIETKIRSAKILYKSERYDDAINAINDILKVQPNNYIMYRLLAYSYTKQEKMNDAEAQFQQYFQKVPATEILPTDYSNYAKALSKNGKDSIAILTMTKAMAADNTIDFSADILTGFFKQKKYSNVVAEYEKMYAKNPTMKDPNTFYNAARSYYNLSRYKDADTTYGLVNKLSPKYAGAWWGRVRCNLIMDSTNTLHAAKPFYDKYLSVVKLDDPKNKNNIIESYHYLADYAINVDKDEEKAKELNAKVLELDPNDEQANNVLKSFNNKKK